MDTVPVDQLYLKYFEKHFVSYADGGFACDAKELFDSLPEGVYDAFARVRSESEGIDRRVPLVTFNAIDRRSASHGSEVVLKGDKKRVRLIKRSLVDGAPGGSVFSVKRFTMNGHHLRVYGVYFLPGRNADGKNHATYYLTLQGADGAHTFDLQPVLRTEKVRPHVSPGDFGSYGYGFFTSLDPTGVDLSALPPGSYTVQVSMSVGGGLFTHPAGRVELGRDGGKAFSDTAGAEGDARTGARRSLRSRLRRL
ncbi:hypothetical protein [Streptomyces sp. NPDC004976]